VSPRLVSALSCSLAFALCPALASASVTVGQIAPTPPTAVCSTSADLLQPTVSSGNSFVFPLAGTVTSWQTNAAPNAGQELTMKVFRKVGEPATYQAVGHSGPFPLVAGTENSFPSSLPVQAGDFLGLHTANASGGQMNGCVFPAAEVAWESPGNLSDGQSAPFTADPPGFRVNVSASLLPANEFSFGETKRNKKKGTATLTVTFPNPGVLLISGAKQLGATKAGPNSTRQIAGPGEVQIGLRATGKKRKALDNNGRVKIPLRFTFTPPGGDPLTKPKGLKLRKLG
jgi:hypothetical protein